MANVLLSCFIQRIEESLFGYDYMIATMSSLFSASCFIKKIEKMEWPFGYDYMIAIMASVFSLTIEGRTARDLSSDSSDDYIHEVCYCLPFFTF